MKAGRFMLFKVSFSCGLSKVSSNKLKLYSLRLLFVLFVKNIEFLVAFVFCYCLFWAEDVNHERKELMKYLNTLFE